MNKTIYNIYTPTLTDTKIPYSTYKWLTMGPEGGGTARRCGRGISEKVRKGQ